MGQLSSKVRRWEGGGKAGLHYWCQGCDQMHSVVTEGAGAWGYNGNPEAPTFTPSVLLRNGHYASTHKPGGRCWCDYNREHPDDEDRMICVVCHTFITDGMVQFLGDCTHQFAGQTLPLPDLPEQHKDQAA